MTATDRKDQPAQVDRRRRRHPRYRTDFHIKATYFEGGQPSKTEGHCNDLSEAGMGLLLPTGMNNGEVIGLNFSLPESSAAWQIRAVVRYRHGYHYGVEFLSLTATQRATLKKYLSQLNEID